MALDRASSIHTTCASRTVADGVDQVAGGGEVPNRFGDKSLAENKPVAGRAAATDPAEGGPVILRCTQFADRDEQPVLPVQFANLALEKWEQSRLDAIPQAAQCAVFAHVIPPEGQLRVVFTNQRKI
jgi:hypothetical protein